MTRLFGAFDRRSFLAGAAGASALAALPFSAAKAQPSRGGHIRLAKADGETTDTLNPGTWTSLFMMSLSFSTHGRLTEVGVDGSLQPELAESWEASKDAKNWRFKIRQGVTFHDGKPLTAEDVVASINFHRGEQSTSAAAPLVKQIKEISMDGADTVTMALEAGNADFPFILTDYHLTIHPAKDGSIDWQSGNGAGSYIIENFEPGITASFTRNPNHWRDSVGFFDSAEILALPDPNSRSSALISGDVDVIDKLDLKTAGLLGLRAGFSVRSVAGTAHYTFAMQTTLDPYSDNNIRQALKYGINREEMVEKILFGYGVVGNDHPIGPGQRYFNTELEQKTYDPERAKWFLKQAGVDSVSVSLSAADAAFPGSVDAATLYQNSAKAAGIDIQVVREPNDGYWSDVWLKKPFVAVNWGGRPVEDQMFSTAYACGVSWNDSNWCNETFDELLVSARAELDDEKRRDMYFRMQDMVANQGGVVIPMFASHVFAVSEKVNVPEQVASNWTLDGERWMERWSFS